MEDFEDKGFRMHSLESYLLVHLWACKFLLEFWLCLTFGLHAVLLGLLCHGWLLLALLGTMHLHAVRLLLLLAHRLYLCQL